MRSLLAGMGSLEGDIGEVGSVVFLLLLPLLGFFHGARGGDVQRGNPCFWICIFPFFFMMKGRKFTWRVREGLKSQRKVGGSFDLLFQLVLVFSMQ